MIRKLKSFSLFLKLASIMLISSIAICIITTVSVMNISKKLFINNFSITNAKILKQIQDNCEDLNDKLTTVISTVNNNWALKKYLSNNTDNLLEQLTISYNLKQSMLPLENILNSVNIDFLTIGTNNAHYIGSSAQLTRSIEDIKKDKITKNTLKNPSKLLFQYSDTGFTSATENNNVIIATKVLYNENTKQQIGILYINLNQSMFKKLYSNFPTKGNDIFMISFDGTIVSSNRTDLQGKQDIPLLNIAKKINSEKIKYMNIKTDNKNYTVLASYMPIYNFYLVNRVDTNLAMDEMYNINDIIINCFLIVTISVVILFIIIRKTIMPLRVLVKQMSKVTEGNFKNYIYLQGGYEIERLSSSFNIMLKDLNKYIDEILIAQKKQREAELSALQMQINPHFIYNTLASIKWLVLKGDKEKSSENINAFISLLQNTISNTNETITLEQELENLKNYVFINETRYGDSIKVTYHVLPQCLQYKLPKLILQPFIENAFFHAFTDNKEGHIHVFISEKNKKLFCEIMDNGTGMNNKQVSNLYSPTSKSRHFTGIGIKNVDDRIKMLYGNEFGIAINSEIGIGTTINVSLPLIK